MLKLTPLNSRLKISHTNKVVEFHTVPNNNTIADMYMYSRICLPQEIIRNSSLAR